jgi:hypothetical protein
VRYKVVYRDPTGEKRSETLRRRVDAERRKAELELELANGSCLGRSRGEVRLAVWAAEWVETRYDLRATTWARLRTTMDRQVLPRFGTTPLIKITNAAVRAWVAEMLDAGLSAATARKAVFALRRCLAAAMADWRLRNAADVRVGCGNVTTGPAAAYWRPGPEGPGRPPPR